MKQVIHLRGTLGTDGSIGAHPRYHENGRSEIELQSNDSLKYDPLGVKVTHRDGAAKIMGETLYSWWRVLKVELELEL